MSANTRRRAEAKAVEQAAERAAKPKTPRKNTRPPTGTIEREEYDLMISDRADRRLAKMAENYGPIEDDVVDVSAGMKIMREEYGISRTAAFIDASVVLAIPMIISLVVGAILMLLVYSTGEAGNTYSSSMSRVIFSAFPVGFFIWLSAKFMLSDESFFFKLALNGKFMGVIVVLVALFTFLKINSAMMDYAAAAGKPDYLIRNVYDASANSQPAKDQAYLKAKAELKAAKVELDAEQKRLNANPKPVLPEGMVIDIHSESSLAQNEFLSKSMAYDEIKREVEYLQNRYGLREDDFIVAARRAGKPTK